MPEWLYEAGIGEARAALVDSGTIVEAAIERDGTLAVGTVVAARLGERRAGRSAHAVLPDGTEVDLVAAPPGTSQGATLSVRIVRESLIEPGRVKPPRGMVTNDSPLPGPDLRTRIEATGIPVRRLYPHDADALEAAGWSETLDEAITGDIAFPGGMLRMIPTPAMTLFDVDGSGALEPLAIAAAGAVASAIVRHGIGGSIGIDFPTLPGKAPRQAVAAAIDVALPLPFERTAVNGFGFLQIVRLRPRPSLPELLRGDPVGAAALAALRRIERSQPGSHPHHRLPGAIVARIGGEPAWTAELARRTGVLHRMEPV
ncbi:ribonuclease [uncultured Sphingomonas sp.]|uniref:ribonuclease n=1 Tax=uncultured Sphingomonas sp. TaxID=158754 RepID=UPI0035CA9EB2